MVDIDRADPAGAQIKRARDIAQRDVAARTEHPAVADLTNSRRSAASPRRSPPPASPVPCRRAPWRRRPRRSRGSPRRRSNRATVRCRRACTCMSAGVDAQAFAGNLRQRRFEPLADAYDAGPHLQPPSGISRANTCSYQRAPLAVGRRAVCGLLGEHRNSQADPAAVRLAALLPRAHRRRSIASTALRAAPDSRRCRNICRVNSRTASARAGHEIRRRTSWGSFRSCARWRRSSAPWRSRRWAAPRRGTAIADTCWSRPPPPAAIGRDDIGPGRIAPTCDGSIAEVNG